MANAKRPRPTVIRWERGGVTMTGTLLDGRWYFTCDRFPSLAQHDGSPDSADAVADLERLTGTAPPQPAAPLPGERHAG